MNPTQCLVVLMKELTDAMRDRKAIAMMLATAVLSPLIYVGVQTIGASRGREPVELVLPIAGAEHAPALVDWLTQQPGLDVVPAPADPRKAIDDGKADVVLIVKKDFSDRLARVEPAAVSVMSDSTRNRSARKAARARALVARYGAELASLRLMARGVAPAVAAPVSVDDLDVSNAEQRVAFALLALPIFFGATALMCAAPFTGDATSGERERGSLEPLLLNPVSSATVVAGKWLAAAVFGSGSIALCVFFSVGAFRLVPWYEFGVRVPAALNARTVWSMLALYVPLTLEMSALMMCVGTSSRSFKEAQGFGALLMPLPFLPLVVSLALPLSNQPWLAPVPVVGQFALARDVFAGAPVSPWWFVLAAVSALAGAAALVGFAARLLRRESIVFS